MPESRDASGVPWYGQSRRMTNEALHQTAEMIRAVAEMLVQEKRLVQVRARHREEEADFILKVAPQDLPLLMGPGGRTARSLRTLVKSAGKRQEKHYSLWIGHHDADEKKQDQSGDTSCCGAGD